MNMPGPLDQMIHRISEILWLAVKKFARIDGAQRAGAFAFNAFFSLFPLMILLVTIGSSFVDRDTAGKEVIACMKGYVPIGGEMQHHVFRAIAGVIEARRQASAVAFAILVWVALQCFTALICATDRAWDATAYNWWQVPLKSLLFLAIVVATVFLAVGAAVLARIARDWFLPRNDFTSWVYATGSLCIPLLVMFLGLSLFYWLAPRRPTRFAEVWPAALCATALLQAAGSLFVIYLKNFATLNAVYGAFGGIMALLLWIYLSGCIFIFGACLCAAGAEARIKTTPPEGPSSQTMP
jgi:Ca2+-transporting ATPase